MASLQTTRRFLLGALQLVYSWITKAAQCTAFGVHSELPRNLKVFIYGLSQKVNALLQCLM